ncbi:hypothetical protein J8M20_07120 [Pseudoalteromonas luteoviolacea]|uniref:hypothetical protein n=1 Tax=Pseudoalteromonas luteoviolacea TaxID=43657 RepID=UPI001B383D2A|nr:hypothetical protein [Pseudoalteromonas luteoviolacea]MBQ4811101.1 hypothetical protein [Pseudoalteromonas luteoviolacea]
MWTWLLRKIKRDKFRELKINSMRILLAHLDVSHKSDCKPLVCRIEKILNEFESAITIDVSDALELYKEPSELIDIAEKNDWLEQCLFIKKQLEFYHTGKF